MEIDVIFDRLSRFQGKQFEIHKGGWPAELKESMVQLCTMFETSEEDVRRKITSKVVPALSFLFLSFSGIMAIDAVRRHDWQLVRLGLEALAIEDCKFDWRDSTIALAVLYHSAAKIGEDPEKIVDFVANLASARTRKELFYSFCARSPANKQLAKFRVKEGVTATGEFTYEPSTHAPGRS